MAFEKDRKLKCPVCEIRIYVDKETGRFTYHVNKDGRRCSNSGALAH